MWEYINGKWQRKQENLPKQEYDFIRQELFKLRFFQKCNESTTYLPFNNFNDIYPQYRFQDDSTWYVGTPSSIYASPSNIYNSVLASASFPTYSNFLQEGGFTPKSFFTPQNVIDYLVNYTPVDLASTSPISDIGIENANLFIDGVKVLNGHQVLVKDNFQTITLSSTVSPSTFFTHSFSLIDTTATQSVYRFPSADNGLYQYQNNRLVRIPLDPYSNLRQRSFSVKRGTLNASTQWHLERGINGYYPLDNEVKSFTNFNNYILRHKFQYNNSREIQWQSILTHPQQTYVFGSVSYTVPQRELYVGSFGTILNIENGFTNFIPNKYKNRIIEADQTSSEYYLCGTKGLLLSTAKHLMDFKQVNLNILENLNDVKFFNDFTGVVVGDYGVVYTTKDRENWKKVSVPGYENIRFNKIAWSNLNQFYVVGDRGTLIQFDYQIGTWIPTVLSFNLINNLGESTDLIEDFTTIAFDQTNTLVNDRLVIFGTSGGKVCYYVPSTGDFYYINFSSNPITFIFSAQINIFVVVDEFTTTFLIVNSLPTGVSNEILTTTFQTFNTPNNYAYEGLQGLYLLNGNNISVLFNNIITDITPQFSNPSKLAFLDYDMASKLNFFDVNENYRLPNPISITLGSFSNIVNVLDKISINSQPNELSWIDYDKDGIKDFTFNQPLSDLSKVQYNTDFYLANTVSHTISTTVSLTNSLVAISNLINPIITASPFDFELFLYDTYMIFNNKVGLTGSVGDLYKIETTQFSGEFLLNNIQNFSITQSYYYFNTNFSDRIINDIIKDGQLTIKNLNKFTNESEFINNFQSHYLNDGYNFVTDSNGFNLSARFNNDTAYYNMAADIDYCVGQYIITNTFSLGTISTLTFSNLSFTTSSMLLQPMNHYYHTDGYVYVVGIYSDPSFPALETLYNYRISDTQPFFTEASWITNNNTLNNRFNVLLKVSPTNSSDRQVLVFTQSGFSLNVDYVTSKDSMYFMYQSADPTKQFDIIEYNLTNNTTNTVDFPNMLGRFKVKYVPQNDKLYVLASNTTVLPNTYGLYVISPATNTIDTFIPNSEVQGVTQSNVLFDGFVYDMDYVPFLNRMYTANYAQYFSGNSINRPSNVSVFDLNTNTLLGTITISTALGLSGAGAYSIRFNPFNNQLYVSNQLLNSVSIIDPITETIVGTISNNVWNPSGIEFVNEFVYVSNLNPTGSSTFSTLNVYDSLNNHNLVGSFSLFGTGSLYPNYIQPLNQLWVNNANSYNFAVFNLNSTGLSFSGTVCYNQTMSYTNSFLSFGYTPTYNLLDYLSNIDSTIFNAAKSYDVMPVYVGIPVITTAGNTGILIDNISSNNPNALNNKIEFSTDLKFEWDSIFLNTYIDVTITKNGLTASKKMFVNKKYFNSIRNTYIIEFLERLPNPNTTQAPYSIDLASRKSLQQISEDLQELNNIHRPTNTVNTITSNFTSYERNFNFKYPTDSYYKIMLSDYDTRKTLSGVVYTDLNNEISTQIFRRNLYPVEYDVISTTDSSGNLQITITGSNPILFGTGSGIYLDFFGGTASDLLNPQYDGYHTILSYSGNDVVLNIAFGNTVSGTESGTLTFIEQDPSMNFLPTDLLRITTNQLPNQTVEVLPSQVEITATNTALVNIDVKKFKFRLIDGLDLTKVITNYPWLLDAEVQNAVIGEDSDGLVWYKGTWICGRFFGAKWYSGLWVDGEWYGQEWNSVDLVDEYIRIKPQLKTQNLNSSIWRNGTFHTGTWNHGSFYKGRIVNATWNNGIFWEGQIDNILWNNGEFRGGTWVNGVWNDGKFSSIFKPAFWLNGEFKGGDFASGTWFDGIFNQKNKLARFGTEASNSRPAIWKGGSFFDGEIHSNLRTGFNTLSGNATPIPLPSLNNKFTTFETGLIFNAKVYGGTFRQCQMRNSLVENAVLLPLDIVGFEAVANSHASIYLRGDVYFNVNNEIFIIDDNSGSLQSQFGSRANPRKWTIKEVTQVQSLGYTKIDFFEVPTFNLSVSPINTTRLLIVPNVIKTRWNNGVCINGFFDNCDWYGGFWVNGIFLNCRFL